MAYNSIIISSTKIPEYRILGNFCGVALLVICNLASSKKGGPPQSLSLAPGSGCGQGVPVAWRGMKSSS